MSIYAVIPWGFVALEALAPPTLVDSAPPPRPPAEFSRDPGPRELSVDDAVERALAANLALLAERERVPLARAESLAARVRLNPVLSFGADHLDLLGTRYDSVDKAGPQEFFVRADFGVMSGGKRKQRKAHAVAAISVVEREFEDRIRLLVLDVQSACVDVQLARAMVTVVRRDRDLFDGLVVLNEVRVADGDIAEVELMRTRNAADQAGNAMLQSQADLEAAENRLAELLALDTPVTIHSAMRREGDVGDKDELRALARRNRPDLRAAAAERERAAVDIKRQIAEGKIDFSLGLEARRQQGLAGTGNSLGVFVAVPLPTSDRNQGGVERARREHRLAGAESHAIVRSMQTQVDNALVAWRSAHQRLERYEGGLLARAEKVLQTVEYSYRRGEASLIELVDAQRSHNEVRRAYNLARADHARALYTLEAVTASPLSP
jgi:outer membrane protein, heavy metal efflux system